MGSRIKGKDAFKRLTFCFWPGAIMGMADFFSKFIAMFTGSADSGKSKAGDDGPTSSEASKALAYNSEPRRYKRATLLVGSISNLHTQLASATAHYRGRSFPVLDLSHTGLALQREEIANHELPDVTQTEPMSVALGLLEPVAVQVALVRQSERVLAFEFSNMSTEGRLAIDKFLDPKMIGLNMRPVDRAFFSPGETFSLWYCGPRDTNFFLWMSGGKVDRSIIQMGEDQFALAPSNLSGVRFVRQTSDGARKDEDAATLRVSVLFALDVALQVRDGGDAIAGLVKLLTEAADTLQAGS
jgi:hypothetical protein